MKLRQMLKRTPSGRSAEDRLIARFFRPLATHPGAFGLIDDCAALTPPGGSDLVLKTDAIVGDVHFFAGDPPDKVAQKALRVNLSDLAAIEDTWYVSGLKATGSHDIVVNDAFVPDYRRLRWIDNYNGVGPGQAVNTSSLYRWIFGQIFFRGVSTGALGALQGMLDAFLRYGSVRVARGARAVDDPGVQLAVAEVAAAIDEMKAILFRDLSRLRVYAERGQLPPLRERIELKFHSALVGERCSILAARLFKAAGGAGLYADLPFGRILADIIAGRQHVSNQYDAIGRNLGAAMFGIEEQKDLML